MSLEQSERAEINRANAQHSTGPKTEAGKERSSRNALRHGLTAQAVVLPSEDVEAYQSHLDSFAADFCPEGALESNLVQSLADASWRLNRVIVMEAHILDIGPGPGAGADAVITFFERQTKAVTQLSLHSQRLSRQIERIATQLRDLQRIRHAQEQEELDAIIDITEMYESRGETYDPAEDGFVFSQTKLDDAISARTRDRLHDEALEDQDEDAA